MSASGTFTPGKPNIRPGRYIRFVSTHNNMVLSEAPGIAVIPFMSHPYGPMGTFVEINAGNINTIAESLGFNIDDSNSNMLLVREALKECQVVKVFLVGSAGVKANATVGALKATAKYSGTRGNSIKVAVTANVVSGFDISVYLDNEKKYEYVGLAKVGDAIALDCPYVDFSASGENTANTALTASAGTSLTSGTNGTATNNDFTAFLDALDYTQFSAVCLPEYAEESAYTTRATAFISKIKYLRDNFGKAIVGVVAKRAADHIGIINVTNAPIVDGVELTVAQATAWVCGLCAGSTELDNNTNKRYEGATGFTSTNLFSHERIEQAIVNGEFVFTYSENGEVVVEYDINSLTTLDDSMDESYKKNRVIRTFDAVATNLKEAFPVGKFSSTESEFDVMDGLGMAVLTAMEQDGSLTNVSEGDFEVDRNNSQGDSAYYNVAIQAVDSIVKSYFTIATR